MEPRPWSEEGATEVEMALLRAGRADGPRKEAELHLLATLQTAPASVVKAGALKPWLKVGFIAVVAGGASGIAYHLSRSHAVAPSASAVAPVAVQGEGRGQAVPSTVSEGSAREPAPPAVGKAEGRDSRALPKASREPPAKPPGAGEPSLGDETRALDRAREALEAHQPSLVLRRLDEYRHKFPQGRLRPEAMILRLAALLAADRRQTADSLARKLLSDPTYEPYVPRIQSLLREARP